jgi:hypothetical protein
MKHLLAVLCCLTALAHAGVVCRGIETNYAPDQYGSVQIVLRQTTENTWEGSTTHFSFAVRGQIVGGVTYLQPSITPVADPETRVEVPEVELPIGIYTAPQLVLTRGTLSGSLHCYHN